ncbi:MAG: B12-binding domain-containing radical SAM protein [Pseudomonadota bacterium]
MKILLVYPRYPDTFWGFKHALEFISAKSAFPPLGLLTVAAMTPPDWEKKLVDLNVEELKDADLAWADLVFVSAMSIQAQSVDEVLERCRKRGVKVVAGGPHFTHLFEQIKGVDHFLLGEVEEIFPTFARDLAQGQAQPLYKAPDYPELNQTPAPQWDLIDFSNYTSMLMQYSRGCPFDCEFCDVVALFGRRPRYKSPEQFLAELDGLYQAGWRGNVMIVDDNFIGNKTKALELLKKLVDWQEARGYPFFFVTQASINMADQKELLQLMAKADFKQVFIGIETPSAASLKECDKTQNLNRDLLAAVKMIHSYGMEVMAGFIVGFDADPPTIFDDQQNFIETAAIPTAMVGVLMVWYGTRLWDRMQREGRLLGHSSGDNVMDVAALNFEPKMDREVLVEGYKDLLKKLYRPEAYYNRVLAFFRDYIPQKNGPGRKPTKRELAAFFRILLKLGLLDSNRRLFWRFFLISLFNGYDIGMAASFAANGYHFWTTSRSLIDRK